MLRIDAIHAFLPVAIGALGCTALVLKGAFDGNLGVGTGSEEYAEVPDPRIYGAQLIRDWKFPANAAVNVLYTVIGTYWVLRTLFRDPSSVFAVERPSSEFVRRFSSDAFLVGVFAWMAVLYGPAQFLRITTQDRRFAVLDQWFTLPFFSWVVCLIWRGFRPRTNPWLFLLVELASLASYAATFVSEYGFDAVLGLHVVGAVGAAVLLIKTYPERGLLLDFSLALLCTCGFVFLKLADHSLAAQHPFFTKFSGHFWSKIFDAFQVHFVCRLFERFNDAEYLNFVKKAD